MARIEVMDWLTMDVQLPVIFQAVIAVDELFDDESLVEHYTHAPQKTETRACLLVLSIHFHKHFLSTRVPVHFSRFLAKLLLAKT